MVNSGQSRVFRNNTTGHSKPHRQHRSSGSNANEILFSSGNSFKKYVKAQQVSKTICGAPLKVYSKKSA